MIFSSMTPQEEYQLTGAVTGDRLLKLLDSYRSDNTVQSVWSEINEAIASLPDEDYLRSIINMVSNLQKKVRGDNKLLANAILDELYYTQGKLSGDADYITEKLNSAISGLDYD